VDEAFELMINVRSSNNKILVDEEFELTFQKLVGNTWFDQRTLHYFCYNLPASVSADHARPADMSSFIS
jgi:hypothetical protein